MRREEDFHPPLTFAPRRRVGRLAHHRGRRPRPDRPARQACASASPNACRRRRPRKSAPSTSRPSCPAPASWSSITEPIPPRPWTFTSLRAPCATPRSWSAVHGGAWKIGDKANTGSIENKLKHWLPKGFIVVSVNYRMLPKAMAYAQAQDVAEALQWVQAYAEDWGGSDRRIILMGHSAGAHLVALLSSRPEMVGKPWAGTVVLDSAAMKVSATMAGRHPKFYDEAFGSDPAGWAQASPMDQWDALGHADVPGLLGPSAPTSPVTTPRPSRPWPSARASSMPVLPQPLTHADVNRTLGLPGAYTDAVDRFIDERLGR
ncbi:alpha/beta hydrolase fold domain-containing protein [Caulobacter segnis]